MAVATGIQQPQPQLRGDRVYEALLQILDRPEAVRGRRLPAELEMAHHLEVSRPVLRQALARLRAEGRIYSRKGSGNFVGERVSAAPSSPTFGPLTSVPDMQALLEFRLLLEGECAARAAIHREPSQRERIRTRRRQFERAVAKGAAGIDEDIAFHVAIAEASDNRFLIATLAAIRDHARSGIQLVRDLSARSPTERMAEVCREHAAIEAAISEGQAEGARRAMTAHLARGIQRLFGK